MKAQKITSSLDCAQFAAITRSWNTAGIGTYPITVQRHDSAVPSLVLKSVQTVDTKASGLLTHPSMMIAGLGLIAPLVVDDRFEVGIIIIKVASYVLIALGCLSIFQSKDLLMRGAKDGDCRHHCCFAGLLFCFSGSRSPWR